MKGLAGDASEFGGSLRPGPADRACDRVSVAMAILNGGRFLEEQLESILHQTVRPDEMVVCDDGSTDGSWLRLEAFAAHAPFPVVLVRNPVALKCQQNFAKAISLCSGDIIVLTDQDDVWYPWRIEDTRAAFASDPELAFTYSDAPLIDEEGKSLGETIVSALSLSGRDRRGLMRGTALLDLMVRLYSAIFGCTMAFRASLRSWVLPIPRTWGHDTWISMVLSSLGPTMRMARPATQYRQHGQQLGGLRPVSMWRHLANARRRGPAAYRYEIEHYQLGLEAIEKHPPCAEIVRLLKEKIAFLERRRENQSGGIHGAIRSVRMLMAGDYARYSVGLRSGLKDLAMSTGILGRTAQIDHVTT